MSTMTRNVVNFSIPGIFFLLFCILILFMLVFVFHIDPKFNKNPTRIGECGKLILESKAAQNQCSPIKAISFLKDLNINKYIGGKFMESAESLRKLAKFFNHQLDVQSIPPKCFHLKDGISWKIVFFVKSSVTNYERRNAIRETWGSIKIIGSALVKIIFLVGTNMKNQINPEISKEVDEHKDILYIDIDDRNVPEKVLAGMQWSAQYLSPKWIYASVDDDMIVYLHNLVGYVDDLLKPIHTLKPEKAPCYEDFPLLCVYNYQSNDIPSRDSSSKWYISKKEFPNKFWPPYCRGGLYLMSNNLASNIFAKSRQTARLYLDDVWITGFMRRKLNQGECNILAAPYSEFDGYEGDIAMKKVFVKHLWGNIKNIKVDVVNRLREEWTKIIENIESSVVFC